MQPLTAALKAILRSSFQAAADGYGSRLEFDYFIPGYTAMGSPTPLLLSGVVPTNDPSNTKNYEGSMANVTDGNTTTTVWVTWTSSPPPWTHLMVFDLGATPPEIEYFDYYWANGGDDRPHKVQHSDNGVDWTETYSTASWVDMGTFWRQTLATPQTHRYWRIGEQNGTGIHVRLDCHEIKAYGTPNTTVADSLGTTSLVPRRVRRDTSRRVAASQVTIEVPVPDNAGALLGPDAQLQAGDPVRVYQRYGILANEVLTFKGLIDELRESRDHRSLVIQARDLMKRLLVDGFSAIAPQGSGETGAVRTEANGVFLDQDADYIVGAILDAAGWPTADRDIAPTGFALDEYLLSDGASWAACIIGENRLTGLTGYDAWVDELGIFHFRPMLASAAPDSDTAPTPHYTYEIGSTSSAELTSRNVLHLEHSTDDRDLKTRVKIRANLASAKPVWTELWHTNLFKLPVGVWYDPAQSTHLRVLDRGTKKVYNLEQATRTKDPAGIWPLYVGGDVTYPLGLSGDPADSTVFWILEAAWRATGSADLSASIHKYRKSDGVHLAEYPIANGRWTDLKVSSSFIWLANFDTDKVHKHSKTDGSSIDSYTLTYNSVAQVNPSGIFVDGTTLGTFWYGKTRFLLVDESDPTTVDTTNALGVTSGVISTAGTKILGGEMDTDTDADLFACSDDLGLVWKYALTEPTTSEVYAEVSDQALEDELGFLSGAEDRIHDSHSGDPAHPYEVRRETLTLEKTITNIAQAYETAYRLLEELAHRRETVDYGIVGNPGIQRGDLHLLIDPVTGLNDLYVVDTYADSMDEGGYLGTVAYVPYDPSY